MNEQAKAIVGGVILILFILWTFTLGPKPDTSAPAGVERPTCVYTSDC